MFAVKINGKGYIIFLVRRNEMLTFQGNSTV